MEKKDLTKLAGEAIAQLPEGAFLVSGDMANPMTIGWATFGIVWGKPICTVFVRHTRYSHELMEKSGSFTVSVPFAGKMREALGICGSRSGRDIDKMDMAKLTLADGSSKMIDGCHIHFVCKTVAKTEMDMDNVSKDILTKFYNTNQKTADGDPHTIYFGEIVDAYEA